MARERQQRPTEPLPKTARPALLFLLAITIVVLLIAASAVIVDRMIYG